MLNGQFELQWSQLKETGAVVYCYSRKGIPNLVYTFVKFVLHMTSLPARQQSMRVSALLMRQ